MTRFQKKFCQSAGEGKFPPDNLALHLFLDIADWYAHDSVKAMQYSLMIKLWWSLGTNFFENDL